MKKIINRTLALVFATVALSSCLKDDSMVLDPDKAGANVIDFVNPTDIAVHGSTTPLYVYSFPIVAAPTPIELSVSYSGAEDAAPKDITVNIGLAAKAVVDQYNTEQNKSFEVMPTSYYTLSATSVVIPKGKKTASFTVSFNTSAIDLAKSYVLPLKLTSADAVVSSNFGTALFQVGVKNKYDGLYTITATAPMVDVTASTLTGYYPLNKMSLITTGANSVAMYDGQYATSNYAHPIKSGTATSSYGQFSPIFTMNPTTGAVVSVENYFGQPSANGRSAALNPAGVNKFTVNADGSKTLEVSYYLLQPGTSIRTSFHEKWTYTGARP
ncbi:DUF1735 domain-containing protein [Pedobacter insulae]|uniref:BT-3987-like N-terminal domain-containing protein n=1 Tax=Pedobacter insulae TaxID=414048 RepID=A0A1I2SZD9_9SPHI|nr:DUF1735 domain-containing protein [Pedobacter insulae]SFG57930.1 protein of unknown function [Pedobacter insulae]